MKKLLLCLLASLLPGTVLAFPTELANTSDVAAVAAIHSDGRLAVVQVENREPFTIRCDAVFHNGPEQSRTRRAIIEPAQSASLSWMPRRNVVRLRVELRCERQD